MLTILLPLMMILSGNSTIYDFKIKDVDGKTINFNEYKGKKILLVNVASECGKTPQYEGLQELSVKYKDQLVIIGIPANNFGGQEPGTDAEIKSFCTKTYHVTFKMASKLSAKGEKKDAIFKWLTEQENPDFKGEILWNFEKFLIDENGKLIRRFRSGVKPNDEELIKAIKK